MIMGRYRTGTAAMKKYQQLAQQLSDRALGVWFARRSAAVAARAGDRSGMSFMTVSHAYQLLESGAHRRRPQSGYYVAPSR